MGKKRYTFLIKFSKNVLSALKVRQVRLYGSKFSKKVYTLHQHIVLLVLREYFKGMGYRRFCSLLPDFSLLLNFLRLSQVPHFTTLQKVSQRLKGTLIEGIFLGFVRRAKFHAGTDSTGMSLQHSTYYYEQRLEHFRKTKKKRKPGRPKKRRKKKHQYTNFFADLDAQLILATKLARGSQSDNRMMIPTVKKAKEIFKQVTSHDTDKGYDAEYNHKYVNEEMKAEDHIKLKNQETPVHRTKGQHRKQAKQKTKNKIGRPRKNHRNKIESIIFTLKKVLGEHLTAKKATNQRQQTRFRIIAYNAYRKTLLKILKHFYTADLAKVL